MTHPFMGEYLKPLIDRLLGELNLTAFLAAICTASLASAYLFPEWRNPLLIAAIFSGTPALFLGVSYLFRHLEQRRPRLTLIPAQVPIAILHLPDLPDILWEVSKRKETPLRDKFSYYGGRVPPLDDYINLHYLSDCLCASCEKPYVIRNEKRGVSLLCAKCGKTLELKDPRRIQDRAWETAKLYLRGDHEALSKQ